MNSIGEVFYTLEKYSLTLFAGNQWANDWFWPYDLIWPQVKGGFISDPMLAYTGLKCKVFTWQVWKAGDVAGGTNLSKINVEIYDQPVTIHKQTWNFEFNNLQKWQAIYFFFPFFFSPDWWHSQDATGIPFSHQMLNQGFATSPI